MIRFIFLTLINLALPFVLRAIYLYARRLLVKRDIKKGKVVGELPAWHFPIRKLLLVGFFLLLTTLAAYRFFFAELDAEGFRGNQVRTGEVS